MLIQRIKFLTTAAIMSGSMLLATLAQASPYHDFTDKLDGLLKDHTAPTKAEGVTFQGVNYTAWGKDSRHAEALAAVQKVDIESLSKTEQKTFWINAYNFLTVDLITREGETKSIRNLGGILGNPWGKFKWKINGTKYTLNHIEHKILRKTGDERIHFAINCASISCPDLLGEAYRASTLDAQLAAQEKVALNDITKGVKIEGNVVTISKIYSWFDDDFNNGDIAGWLKDHIDDFPANANIKNFKYNWNLNKL